VDTFQNSPLVHQIVLVLNKNNIKAGEELRNKLDWDKVSDICVGGERRQDSVANGISHLKTCQWIIIHDGGRPCITGKLIDAGLNQALSSGAAIAAVPAQETIKIADSCGFISSTPERRDLWIAQTPQIFRTDIITEAHHQAKTQHREATDDAALVEAAGYKVKIYMGSYDNIKITTPRDLSLAGTILKQGKETLS
jgi:2-C-methyl-D-erythritol 4-phosphate cytidylyltransferase